jgi:hypothetical protein
MVAATASLALLSAFARSRCQGMKRAGSGQIRRWGKVLSRGRRPANEAGVAAVRSQQTV